MLTVITDKKNYHIGLNLGLELWLYLELEMMKNEYSLKLKDMAFMALFEKTMEWDYLVIYIKKYAHLLDTK
jgi:hypothetical protein